MASTSARPPLVFHDMEALRQALAEHWSNGAANLIGYLRREFPSGRILELGGERSRIFAVQLLRTREGLRGEVLLEFEKEPTPENSRLSATVRLIGADADLQFIVRSFPSQ